MIEKFIYIVGTINIIVLGALATIAILYSACNYAYKLMNANVIFFDFLKNRKAFKEWRKNN
jgi:hypothetical protein